MNNRNSSIELLRILCIFGILMMHSYGMFISNAIGNNAILGLSINALFNTGVSIFVLITGYYGINNSFEKILKLHYQVIFFSIIGLLVLYIAGMHIGPKMIVQSLFPVLTNHYWFITSYMLLMVFSRYINAFIENMNKQQFELLLLIALVIFSIAPTFLFFEIMNDSGKGIINMLIMYMIGRYIRFHWDIEKIKQNTNVLWGGYFCSLIIILCLNGLVSWSIAYYKHTGGLFMPFARDLSLFIIIASICIFLIFMCYTFYSNFVNNIAKHVLAIYLFDQTARVILNKYIDLSAFENSAYLAVVLVIYVLADMILCIGLNFVRLSCCNKLVSLHKNVILAIVNMSKSNMSKFYNAFISGFER